METIVHHLNKRRLQADAFMDVLSSVAYAVWLSRWHSELGWLEIALGVLCSFGVAVLNLLWRKYDLKSYLCWREVVAVAMRLGVTSLPHCWPTILFSLQGGERAWGRHWVVDRAVFCALVAHGSKALLECMLALSRPVRVWIHLPVQLLQVLLTMRGAGMVCDTPTFRAQPAQQLFRRVFAESHLVAGLLLPAPLPISPSCGPCTAVVCMVQLCLGFWLPTLALCCFEHFAREAYARQAALAQESSHMQRGSPSTLVAAARLQHSGAQRSVPAWQQVWLEQGPAWNCSLGALSRQPRLLQLCGWHGLPTVLALALLLAATWQVAVVMG